MKRTAARAVLALTLAATGVMGLASEASAAINVNCATQNLQAKIDSAGAGSTLLIKGTCVGTFTVNKNLRLKGNPTATLDGKQAGTTLTVTGAHTVHLVGLVITGGLASTGGGITAGGGTLTLLGVTVKGNTASDSANAIGGGIYSEGSLSIESSSIVNNKALASGGGNSIAQGGGIYSQGRTILSLSDVSSNRATANSTSNGGAAQGGGLFVSSAPLTVAGSTVNGNRARGTGVTEGTGQGGGIYDLSDLSISISGSTFRGNSATGAASGTGADGSSAGGAVTAIIDTGSISRSSFMDNRGTATSSAYRAFGAGGSVQASADTKLTLSSVRVTGSVLELMGSTDAFGQGGGIFVSGPMAIRGSTTSGNALSSRSGTGNALGQGGGLFHRDGSFTLARSTIRGNRMTVRSTGGEPVGFGGGVWTSGSGTVSASTVSGNSVLSASQGTHTATAISGGLGLGGSGNPYTVVNSTVTGNSARAVGSPTAGDTLAAAGGIAINGGLHLTSSTVARNHVSASAFDMTVLGGGLYENSSDAPVLKGTILALNTSPVGPDCYGEIVSLGHNLLGSKAACVFAAKPTDKIGKDPKLGPLADNGGPTRTLALLSGSPARNAIPKAACAVKVDQRGVRRPQGARCDIGSYERKV